MSRSSDIIFLLGAGASVDAAIPASGMMIQQVETLLKSNAEWAEFEKLYNHIKSAIHYAAGLKGNYHDNVLYNIETLVNTLYELERNEQHPLYPFIASWNSRIVSLAGGEFQKIKDFRSLLLKQLKKWMCPEDPSRSNYYSGLVQIQRNLNFPIRLFSLNYDLCVERLNAADFRVETGFPGIGSAYEWDFERFEEPQEGAPLPQIYLYKLHGSINWKRGETQQLYCLEQIEGIEAERMEVIFGRDFKLEAADPYLFYAYEFRRWSLSAKVVCLLGYGFGDEHINKILRQSLVSDSSRRIVVIANCSDSEAQSRAAKITQHLGANQDQVIVWTGTARDFLQNESSTGRLLGIVPRSEDEPF
jgi:hypothetical protein